MSIKIKILIMCVIITLFFTSPAYAAISQSSDPSYTLMATGKNYTAYFSNMNTNGFKFVINDHSFLFLPRDISYTNDPGETTLLLGSAQNTQIQNTSDMVYFDNAYGIGGQLRYLSNPIMVKEVYVLDKLPSPAGNSDWMTLSSVAVFNNDLKLKYIDENGVEKSWDGTKTKTNEIKFYDTSDMFQFELPQPLAKDALNSTASGHYLIYERDGILYISARFSYASLANMTLPIYLDLSLAEGQVAFGKDEYILGETLDIWDRGFTWTDERTVLYNPSNQVVATFDWPYYVDGWTSRYTYTADAVGTWRAELQTKPFLWGDWTFQAEDTTNVKLAPTPTPTPPPTPSPTPTPTPVPTTTPGPSGVLYGDIYDTSGNRIYGATITIDTGQTYNNPNSYYYAMQVPSGTRAVTVTASGYFSNTQGKYVEAGRFNNLNFWLSPIATPTPTPTPTPSPTPTPTPTPSPDYTGSITMTKEEYYPGETIEANAINLNPALEYRIKWYKDNVLTDVIPVLGSSSKYTNKLVPGDNSAISAVYKVELTKPDGTVVYSDTAKIVVRPRDVRIAVILAEPSDDTHNKSAHSKNYYLTNIIPDLKDYYKEVSYGAVNIIIDPTDVYDNNGNWYKLGKTAAYYGKNITKTKPDGTTYQDGWDNSTQFVVDAITVSGINYDNYDAIIAVHSNQSRQENSSIWELMETHASGKNITVSESELMGTWAHEIGHRLGTIFQPNKPPNYLPDRYGDKYGNHSIRDWDIMGSGNWLGQPAGSNPDHMSSFSKDWIGWLKNKSIYYPNTGSYWINSIATMKYGDETTRYIIQKEDYPVKLNNYYIIETRTNNPVYSRWDTSAPIPKEYNNAVILYQVSEKEAGKNVTVDFIDNLTISNPGSHSSYWDFANLIHFAALGQRTRTEGTRSILEMNVEITKFSISNKVGAVITPNGNLLGYVPNAPSVPYDGGQILPDFDLHAYALDGRHIGVNYTSGVYENQIEGANASGDLLNGVEWIFVPDNVKVQFVVDSRDIQAFLNQYPDLQKITNGSQPYNLSIVYDSPESIRYSTSLEQSILPGEIRKYNYLISKNPDGTYEVLLDDMPPVISSAVPTNATNNTQITAEFTDSPDGSGIDSGSIVLIIDGIDETRNAVITDGSISVKPVLKDGLHEVRLTVGDKAGNTATANWNFTLDTTPPEITILNISTLTNQTILPDIKIHDARDAKPIVSVSLDGIPYDGSPIASEGEHILTVTASDDLGNTAIQTINFTIDKTPPSISIAGAENDGFYNISKIISYVVTDNIDLAPLVSANYISGAVFNDENDYSVQIIAEDHAGNVATKILNFTIDKTPPIVNITSPTNNSYVGHIVNITGTATDLHMKTVSLDIDSIIVANITAYLWDSTKVSDGEHEIQLNAEDKAGNTASTSIKIKVDNTPPVIQISPANGTEFYSDQNLTIDYNITDATSGVASFSAALDGIAVTKGDLIDLRNLSIDSHTIRVTATDNAGNGAESSTTFIVKPLQAIVEIEPHTLNINSSGRWINAKIEVPGYNARLIDISSIRLNEIIPVEIKHDENEENDTDEKDYVLENYDSELKVKFNRTQVQSIINPGDVILYISGKVNGAAFWGNYTIRVIENKKIESEKETEKSENDKKKGGKSS